MVIGSTRILCLFSLSNARTWSAKDAPSVAAFLRIASSEAKRNLATVQSFISKKCSSNFSCGRLSAAWISAAAWSNSPRAIHSTARNKRIRGLSVPSLSAASRSLRACSRDATLLSLLVSMVPAAWRWNCAREASASTDSGAYSTALSSHSRALACDPVVLSLVLILLIWAQACTNSLCLSGSISISFTNFSSVSLASSVLFIWTKASASHSGAFRSFRICSSRVRAM